MKYTRFQELPVWQDGVALCERIFALTADKAFAYQGDLANQLQRAALSICNNIAEGFERGSTSELLAFLYYARGSAGEVRSMLLLLDRMPRFLHLKSEISNLRSLSESASRQLRAWAAQLQETPIKGQRHLTQATRDQQAAQTRRESFDKLLAETIRQGRAAAEAANLKSDISNLKSEISDLKSPPPSEISNLKSPPPAP
jgi:four helix bundle protein